MTRMHGIGIRPKLDSDTHRAAASELQDALRNRSDVRVGDAMRRLNRLFRDSARERLASAQAGNERISR
jgi:hypothetical protein